MKEIKEILTEILSLASENRFDMTIPFNEKYYEKWINEIEKKIKKL